MRRLYYISSILIIVIFASCESEDSDGGKIKIETISHQDFNYRYNDYEVLYSVQTRLKGDYQLKFLLENEALGETYTSNLIHIDDLSDTRDTIGLGKLDWSSDHSDIEFYNINNNKYLLHLTLTDSGSDEILLQSDKLSLEINRDNNDTTFIDNYVLYDIDGGKHELMKQIEDYDFVLLFGFTWRCGWSLKSISQINEIDSIYGDNLVIIAVEGDDGSRDRLKTIAEEKVMNYPICKRTENLILNDILHPDRALSFPRYLLINNTRKEVFRQLGYTENLVDSISYIVQN